MAAKRVSHYFEMLGLYVNGIHEVQGLVLTIDRGSSNAFCSL